MSATMGASKDDVSYAVALEWVVSSLTHLLRRRLLLQGMRPVGEGPRRVPQDCESGQCEDWPILRAQEIRAQEEMI
jgi:hypothetical protein